MVSTFYRLQCFFEINGLPSFQLIPQFHPRRMMISIDTPTLFALINTSKGLSIRAADRSNKELVWNTLFDMEKLVKRGGVKKFGFSMHYDGVKASPQFTRPKTTPKTDEELEAINVERIGRIRQKLINGEYDLITGIDPGQRLMIGANTLCVNSGTEFMTKYKSSTFRWDTNQFGFKNKRNASTKVAIEGKEAARRVFPLIPIYRIMQNRLSHAELQQKATERAERLATRGNHRALQIDQRHLTKMSSKSWNYRNYTEFELCTFQIAFAFASICSA